MSAFDNIKPTKMPHSPDTTELMDTVSQGVFTLPQAEAFQELMARIIKAGDADDIVENGKQITRGGIRPKSAPIVP